MKGAPSHIRAETIDKKSRVTWGNKVTHINPSETVTEDIKEFKTTVAKKQTLPAVNPVKAFERKRLSQDSFIPQITNSVEIKTNNKASFIRSKTKTPGNQS